MGCLFVSEAVNGVEGGGSEGWEEAEDDADERGEAKGEDDGGWGDEDGPVVDVSDNLYCTSTLSKNDGVFPDAELPVDILPPRETETRLFQKRFANLKL